MKKFALIFVFIFVTITTFAQTTEEEYNYITKGYKIQISSGLDMKKGYTFKDLYLYKKDFEMGNKTGYYQFTFKGLYKDGKIKPCAIMVECKGVADDYLCLPTDNSDISVWLKYLAGLETYYKDPILGELFTPYYMEALSIFLSKNLMD